MNTHLTLKVPTPQNGQAHSNNYCLSVFNNFVGLALKGLYSTSL